MGDPAGMGRAPEEACFPASPGTRGTCHLQSRTENRIYTRGMPGALLQNCDITDLRRAGRRRQGAFAGGRVTSRPVHARAKIVRELGEPRRALRAREIGSRDPYRPARDGDHQLHVALQVRRLVNRVHGEVEPGRVQPRPREQGVEKGAFFVRGPRRRPRQAFGLRVARSGARKDREAAAARRGPAWGQQDAFDARQRSGFQGALPPTVGPIEAKSGDMNGT